MFHTIRVRQARLRAGFLAEESGSSLIEFGVSITLLLLIIFGVMDCSRALYAYHFVSNAARDATRYAMVRGSSWNNASCTSAFSASCTAGSTDVTNYVKAMTPMGFSANQLLVNTTWPGTTVKGTDCSATNVNNTPGCVVNVQVSYTFNFVLPFLPKNSLLLSSTSKVVIAQ